MKIGIFSNSMSQSALSAKANLISLLKKRGHFFLDCADHADLVKAHENGDFVGLDFIAVLGGDGTVLEMAKIAADEGLPVLCINCGSLGFLSEIEPSDIENAIALIEAGKFIIEKRAMLDTVLEGKKYYALNEIAINRETALASKSKVLKLSVFVSGKLLEKIVADGIIIATPTGSTAYALSCGGPVLDPCLNSILITPISPHSLQSRPIVISDSEKVTVTVDDTDCKGVMSCDGCVAELSQKCFSIDVKRSDRTVNFIRLGDRSFYEKLLVKMNKWSMPL